MSDLSEHLRRSVDAIEGEVGDAGLSAHDIEGSTPWLSDETQGTTPGQAVEDAVRTIIRDMGEDPDRQGLARTPARVQKMYAELTAGYHVDADRLINGAIFDVVRGQVRVANLALDGIDGPADMPGQAAHDRLDPGRTGTTS